MNHIARRSVNINDCADWNMNLICRANDPIGLFVVGIFNLPPPFVPVNIDLEIH